MQFSATQIALMIGGKVEGNGDTTVDSFGKIEEAQAGQLAFWQTQNETFVQYQRLYNSRK